VDAATLEVACEKVDIAEIAAEAPVTQDGKLITLGLSNMRSTSGVFKSWFRSAIGGSAREAFDNTSLLSVFFSMMYCQMPLEQNPR
jgi:hypothetical protein